MNAWRDFKGGKWQDRIDVRDFIQKNYTPYTGDESFLQPPTARTEKMLEKYEALCRAEQQNGGVLNIDTETVITATSFGPGYLDKENEIIVGLQTDEPLKRACNPFGGMRMVRDACKKPLMVKLSPQAENIPEMCKAVEAAGADAISLTNTFQACAIDLEKRRPVFDNIFAGLSGPAVRPIALRMVWQAVGAVNIPVVGLGGIATGKDALEFIMAGATAVQVGAANFANPRAMETIAEEMAAWMDAHGVKTLDEIRGCAR